MPQITRSALVSYSAQAMYELVADVDAYPDFLPWCDAATVKESSDSHQLAALVLDRRFKRLQFTTRNQLQPASSITMTLVNGPFKTLDGRWTFTPVGDPDTACKVELSINFQFRSRVLAIMVGPAFSRVCDTMVDAFVSRAHQVYGGKTAVL